MSGGLPQGSWRWGAFAMLVAVIGFNLFNNAGTMGFWPLLVLLVIVSGGSFLLLMSWGSNREGGWPGLLRQRAVLAVVSIPLALIGLAIVNWMTGAQSPSGEIVPDKGRFLEPEMTCDELLAQMPPDHSRWTAKWAVPESGSESIATFLPEGSKDVQDGIDDLLGGALDSTPPVEAANGWAADTGFNTIVMRFADQDDSDDAARKIVRASCAQYDGTRASTVYESANYGRYVRMTQRGSWLVVQSGRFRRYTDTWQGQ